MVKDFHFSPESAHVLMTFPEPVEIADAVLTDADKEAIKKAEEKRKRKMIAKIKDLTKEQLGDWLKK